MTSHISPPPPQAGTIELLQSELARRGITAAAAVPFVKLTTFRVGGPAALFAEPEDEDALLDLCALAGDRSVPILVLGRGSNLLVSESGFPGLVIRLGRGFDWIKGEGQEVEAGAAAALPQVANWAARRSLSGFEFAVAVPASVGGAVRMNAGAHGSEISQIVRVARVLRLPAVQTEDMTSQDLDMSYRRSSLGFGDIVVSARFRLRQGEREEILGRMEAYRAHRSATQPSEARNAGSMFKNPPGESAGRLIESCGLKGFRVGGAEVSVKHANFFTARDGAKAQEVFDLMTQVQRTVADTIGVTLIPEVRVIGEFQRSSELVTGE